MKLKEKRSLKLKKNLLMFLLVTLLTLPLLAEEKTSSSPTSTLEQTQSQKTFYTQEDVLLLVKQLKAEADAAIENAYDEGYKAGVQEYAPKLSSLEVQIEWLKSENKKQNLEKWTIPLWTCVGAGAGFLGGWIIRGN